MFKKSNEKKLGEVLKQISSARKIKPGYDQYRIRNWWKENMGHMVNSQTSNIFLKNQILYISVNSAALRSELNMSKEQLRERINGDMEGELIKKVKVQ